MPHQIKLNSNFCAATPYTHGHGLALQGIDGHQHFYHYDGFHNTRSLTDMDGTVTDSYRYDAYGMLLEQSGNTKNLYLYRGEQFDAETDAYYLRARSYQPATGRFFSTNPVDGMMFEPMTFHRYVYTNNDPVNNVDPSGILTGNEQLTTVNIVGSLAAYPGWALGHNYQNVYAKGFNSPIRSSQPFDIQESAQ